MSTSKKWLKVMTYKKDLEHVSTGEKPNEWRLWKSCRYISRKFFAEKEVAKRNRLGVLGKSVAVREETAAICIQTAFRVFLARKALRALKGLVRLQAAITGHDTPKQSSVSLHCIHAFIRVQARIHRQRTGKIGDSLGLGQMEITHSVTKKQTMDREIDWCNRLGTVQEIQAKEQQQQVAAIKRDRAIAYAFSNKWKAKTKINPGSLFDRNLDNSSWIWIWLDDWLNEQPKKPSIMLTAIKQQKDETGNQTIQKHAAAVGINNHKGLRAISDKIKVPKGGHARIRSPGSSRFVRSLSGGRGRKALPLSPKLRLQSRMSSDNLTKQPCIDVKWKAFLENA